MRGVRGGSCCSRVGTVATSWDSLRLVVPSFGVKGTLGAVWLRDVSRDNNREGKEEDRVRFVFGFLPARLERK